MRRFIKVIRLLVCFIMTCSIIVAPTSIVAFAEKNDQYDKVVGDGGSATGVGLATWMMSKYLIDYPYELNGATNFDAPASDCSGTICMYRHIGGVVTNLLPSAQNAGQPTGSLSKGLPRIHGIGLLNYEHCHVGVYLGSYVSLKKKAGNRGSSGSGVLVTGNEIDNSDYGINMKLQDMKVTMQWAEWYCLKDCTYPKNGEWAEFDGKVYYYEQSAGKPYAEYVVNCEKTIGGKKYSFDETGACKQKVDRNLIKYPSKCISTQPTNGKGPGTSGSSDSTSDSSTDSDSDSTVDTSGSTEDDEPNREAIEVNRELTHQEKIRVEEINKDLSNKTEYDIWSTIYTMIGFCGILLLVYSMLILITYYIDVFNSFTNFSILQFISFGRMYPIGSIHNIDVLGEPPKNVKYINNVTIWFSFVIGVLASAILMNMQTLSLLFIELAHWFSTNMFGKS